jgi:L,D-transpeptidase YbiS
MTGFFKFIKRSLLGVSLLWMALDVQASNPSAWVEQRLAGLSGPKVAVEAMDLRAEVDRLRTVRRKLAGRLEALKPEDAYIVVDTNSGRLFLKEGERILLNAICSTGKGDTLVGPKGQVWIFRTPLGLRTVKLKKVDPVWTKPDWAFIEENEPIPRDRNQRLEEDVLGDYALDIGDDYMIHGTLYTRLLGRPVTHGCIRLADEDLKTVYEASTKGTKVYLF